MIQRMKYDASFSINFDMQSLCMTFVNLTVTGSSWVQLPKGWMCWIQTSI